MVLLALAAVVALGAHWCVSVYTLHRAASEATAKSHTQIRLPTRHVNVHNTNINLNAYRYQVGTAKGFDPQRALAVASGKVTITVRIYVSVCNV